MNAWMLTASGRRWPLTDPGPSDVHWPDIADALAKLCRFNGHCTTFYSVAQHSVFVAELLPPELRPYGLLHDAHEAFLGDIHRPMQLAMDQIAAGAIPMLRTLETAHDQAIHAAACLDWPIPESIRTQIKHADLVALATERRDLMADSPLWDQPLPDPSPRRINAWNWTRAHETFLDRLHAWLPQTRFAA